MGFVVPLVPDVLISAVVAEHVGEDVPSELGIRRGFLRPAPVGLKGIDPDQAVVGMQGSLGLQGLVTREQGLPLGAWLRALELEEGDVGETR